MLSKVLFSCKLGNHLQWLILIHSRSSSLALCVCLCVWLPAGVPESGQNHHLHLITIIKPLLPVSVCQHEPHTSFCYLDPSPWCFLSVPHCAPPLSPDSNPGLQNPAAPLQLPALVWISSQGLSAQAQLSATSSKTPNQPSSSSSSTLNTLSSYLTPCLHLSSRFTSSAAL